MDESEGVALLAREYVRRTPRVCMVLDAYMLACVTAGACQALALAAMRGRPFAPFVVGMLASLGAFVLAAHARLRTAGAKGDLTLEAALELVAGHVALHLLVANLFTAPL